MPAAAAASQPTAVPEITGIERAAILVMYLERDAARVLLSHLTDDEIQRLGVTISAVQKVGDNVIETVVKSFISELRGVSVLPTTGRDFARTVLPDLVDEGRRDKVVRAIRRRVDDDVETFVHGKPPAAVAAVLADEHPQVRAVALLRMGHENAARVLTCFSEDDQYELTVRMARAERVSGELADDVEAMVMRALSEADDSLPVGGVETTARILGQMSRERNMEVLNRVRDQESDLADRLQRLMVVFEDLAALDDRGIQTLLRGVDRADLVPALKGARADLRDRFLRNLSSRAAQDLLEEIEISGAMRKSQIRAAQERIVDAAQRLAEEGALVLDLAPEPEH
jgi:flagellar motor switch protein FliG